MERKDIEPFLDVDNVAVGIPSEGWSRPFYFYGKITELTDKFLVIRYTKGLKKINLNDIEDIQFTGEGY